MTDSTTSVKNRGDVRSLWLTYKDVDLAASSLVSAGRDPSIRAIRKKLGRGSHKTITKWMRVWLKRNKAMLDKAQEAFVEQWNRQLGKEG